MKSEEQAIKAAQQFIREAEAAADFGQLYDSACGLVMPLERRSEVRDFVRSNAAISQAAFILEQIDRRCPKE